MDARQQNPGPNGATGAAAQAGTTGRLDVSARTKNVGFAELLAVALGLGGLYLLVRVRNEAEHAPADLDDIRDTERPPASCAAAPTSRANPSSTPPTRRSSSSELPTRTTSSRCPFRTSAQETRSLRQRRWSSCRERTRPRPCSRFSPSSTWAEPSRP